MIPAYGPDIERIAASLHEHVHGLKAEGFSRWSFSLSNGKPFSGDARLDEGWLLLKAHLTDCTVHPSAWSLLQTNAQLGGVTKFGFAPQEKKIRLWAEIPLDLDDDEVEVELSDHLPGVCHGLKSGVAFLHGEKTAESRECSPRISSADTAPVADPNLAGICRELGWPFTERSALKLAVDLDTRGRYQQAILEQDSSRGTRVSSEITVCDSYSPTCREALAVLLLTAGGIVRFARPVIDETESRVTARFEVRFAGAPRTAEVNHALCALSVASELCGRESRVLEDIAIAERYLLLHGVAGQSDVAGHSVASNANLQSSRSVQS